MMDVILPDDLWYRQCAQNHPVVYIILHRLQTSLEWSIDADLTRYWTWNTKAIFAFVQAEYISETNKLNQVSLHDTIILRKKDAKLKKKNMRQEYEFVDQGQHLRGKALNMTLTWEIMPRVGASCGLANPTATLAAN
jgi:hypothetical protein